MSLKSLVRDILPYGFVVSRRERQRQRLVDSIRREVGYSATHLSYDDIIAKAAQYGNVPEDQVRAGSMPLGSLNRITNLLKSRLSGPSVGLQVGNFVGVSLVCLLSEVPNCRVIAVDPNIPHRGVLNPQAVVARLLAETGTADRCLLVQGYSLGRNLSSDGMEYAGYRPDERFHEEVAPTNVLESLITCGVKADFILVDGNHDYEYVRRENEKCRELLKRDGLMIFDDVSDDLPELKTAIQSLNWKSIFEDGRVMIATR